MRFPKIHLGMGIAETDYVRSHEHFIRDKGHIKGRTCGLYCPLVIGMPSWII